MDYSSNYVVAFTNSLTYSMWRGLSMNFSMTGPTPEEFFETALSCETKQEMLPQAIENYNAWWNSRPIGLKRISISAWRITSWASFPMPERPLWPLLHWIL